MAFRSKLSIAIFFMLFSFSLKSTAQIQLTPLAENTFADRFDINGDEVQIIDGLSYGEILNLEANPNYDLNLVCRRQQA